MRIISMEVGGDVKSVFQRFVKAVKTCEEIVKKESYEFMHNEHLGWASWLRELTGSTADNTSLSIAFFLATSAD